MSSAAQHLLLGDRQRRRQREHIAHGGLEGEAAVERGIHGGLGEVLVRLHAGAVAHQLDADQQAAPAHVADGRDCAPSSWSSRSSASAPTRAAFSTRPSSSMISMVVSARPRRHRVLLVRVVAERPLRADVELRPRQHGRDRQDAAAQRLAEHENVGRHAVVLAGEHRAGLAEPGRDLVEHEQRAVAVAGGAHARPEAGRRQVGHGADRLGDERGDVALALQHVLDHAARRPRPRLPRSTCRRGSACCRRARHAPRRRPAALPGPERNSASPDSAPAPMPAPWKASQNDSVLSRPVAARAILTATSMASEPPVVNSTLAGLNGEMSRELARQRHGRRVGVAARREGQRLHLLGDGLLQARMAVADVMHVVAVEIHVAPAGHVLDPDALGLGNGVEARRRHRLAQEVARVLGQQRAVVSSSARACQAARRLVRLVSPSD